MKIYTTSNAETDSIEVLINYQELQKITNALIKFKGDVEQFRVKNIDKKNVGFTHLHLRDCGLFEENSNTDIVFYLNLSE